MKCSDIGVTMRPSPCCTIQQAHLYRLRLCNLLVRLTHCHVHIVQSHARQSASLGVGKLHTHRNLTRLCLQRVQACPAAAGRTDCKGPQPDSPVLFKQLGNAID